MKHPPSCQRCGTCCTKGGPTLHTDDLPLLSTNNNNRAGNNALRLRSQLITIRQGEPVFSPLCDGIEPAGRELIKITGRQDTWACCFFEPTSHRCLIYAQRPLECHTLKCWQPAALTGMIYQNCLSRRDLLPANDTIWPWIDLHEEQCGFAKLANLAQETAGQSVDDGLTAIARMITIDLQIRQQVVKDRQINLAEELLLFGRPLFKSLTFYGLTMREDDRGITVQRR